MIAGNFDPRLLPNQDFYEFNEKLCWRRKYKLGVLYIYVPGSVSLAQTVCAPDSLLAIAEAPHPLPTSRTFLL